ncbi:unnamed protein product, partial [Polarella glacialis]
DLKIAKPDKIMKMEIKPGQFADEVAKDLFQDLKLGDLHELLSLVCPNLLLRWLSTCRRAHK